MKINKTIISIAFIILLAVSVFFWAKAYNDVNNAYPSYRVTQTSQGEWGKVRDISIRTGDVQMFDHEDFITEFELSGQTVEDLGLRIEESKITLVDFEITYNGSGEITPGEVLDKYLIYFQSGLWNTPYDMVLVGIVNDTDAIADSLNTGDSFKVKLPFFGFKSSMSEKLWNNFETQKFEVVINYYPDRFIFELN